MRATVVFLVGMALVLAGGCAAATAGPPDGPAAGGGDAGLVDRSVTGDAAGPPAPDGGADAVVPVPTLVGVYTVRGTDARGSYEGQAEVTADGAGYRFVRTVRYPGLTVEGGRELHWAFTGTLTGTPAAVALSAELRRADFIWRRGTLERTAADGPVPLTGTLTQTVAGELSGTLTAAGIELAETWSSRRPSDGTPLFRDERVFLPGHPSPSPSEKAANFALYADFHTLAVVAPYVPRPEFQAAIHGNFFDPTDFEFYRQHPNALRVAQKVIDDISLAETLARANAYRLTLAEKAAAFQHDMDTRFMDPAVGMVVDSGPPGGGGPYWPSGDAALWTGTYVAAQAYRYQATGDAAALPPLVTALEGLLKLQEITGDWSQFARTLRPATGSPTPPWHAGTGPYAGLEWLEGGNNDMIKGLFYGYLLAHGTLCTGALGGYDSYCARIRTNARHLADDVRLDLVTSDVTNRLPSAWLVAVISADPIERITYRTLAEGYWTVGKIAIQATPVYYGQGIVDWSGQHLTFVGDLIEIFLAQGLNLGGDAADVLRAHVDASYANLAQQRFVTWHFLKAACGTGGGPASPWLEDARWRMREIPHPKRGWDIDRRIGTEFCMSPYPSVPWKMDWMQYPDPDRTEGLAVYPIYESTMDVTLWKVGADYRSSSGYENTGADYLHVYWFARAFGLLAATE
jgi:hypothetical protein